MFHKGSLEIYGENVIWVRVPIIKCQDGFWSTLKISHKKGPRPNTVRLKERNFDGTIRGALAPVLPPADRTFEKPALTPCT